jgi:pSer/pThr/pTyr-binding forkhead associated (FHA) protein
MKLSLVVMTAGKATGQTIPVTLAQFIIGRDPQCNLRPASPVISKRHCALLTKNGKVTLRDLDSTNGTFINDKPLKGECVLNNGDIMKVGPLAFRVTIESSTPVNKPTPPPPPPKLPASPAPVAASDDDDVANMLLSLQDETGTSPEAAAAEAGSVPEGSTVMDMLPLGDTSKDADLKKEEPKKEEEPAKTSLKKEPPKAPPATGDARSAAAALLQKYSRRER